MLSNASKYAIRAVLYLAEYSSPTQRFGAKQIADELEIPRPFIAKLLQQLAKAKIISSSKGPHGGFYTTEENLRHNICSILNEIESENIFEGCFLGLPQCSDENPCPVHFIVAPFKKAILEKFKNQSIKDFADEVKKNGAYLSLKGVKKNILED